MLRLQHTKECWARPLPWVHYKGEFYDPFWEDLLQSYQRDNQRLNPTTSSQRKNKFNDPVWNIFQAKKKVIGKKQGALATPIKATWHYIPEIIDRLRHHVSSPEFWLGVIFGVATRITTRLAIMAAFPATPRLATVASFAACAGAGIAAGIVTHLIRTWYRNSKLARGDAKEIYFGRALLESAVIGLFGGVLGGTATNAGAIIARSGSFAVGATAGVAAGILHASVKNYKLSRGRRADMGWGKLALQGAIFGALGGVLGVIFTDLFSAHDSVAASVPVGEAGSVIYVPPTVNPHMLDTCGTENCGFQPPPLVAPVAPVAPLQSVIVAPPPSEVGHLIEKTAHHPAHHHLHHKAHHRVHHPKQPCKVVKHKHVKHHIKHHKAAPKVIEKTIIIERTVPEPPPPPPVIIMAPPPQVVAPPPPVNPCDTGNCGTPCDSMSQLDTHSHLAAASQADTSSALDLKGPCANSDTACGMVVKFDENGDATKVVLEPLTGNAHSPHFELATTKADWNNAARTVAVASNDEATDASNVSLIVPLVRHIVTPSAASVVPTPV